MMKNTTMITDDKDIEDDHHNANRSKNEKSNSHHDHNLHHDHQHHDHQHHEDDIDVNIDYNHALLLTTLNRTLSITEPLLQRISKTIYSNIIIIGIAGGSGSGKTTLTKAIYESIGKDNITYISHDSYYKDLSHLSIHERSQQNFDHPDSLDTDLLIEHIKLLKNNESIVIPTYDYNTHSRVKPSSASSSAPSSPSRINTSSSVPFSPSKISHLSPSSSPTTATASTTTTTSIEIENNTEMITTAKSIILVEGILIFTNSNLYNLFDVKIYVDTDNDIRLIRRIQRDVKERGRSIDSIITQYLTTVRPMHIQYVEPSKRNADIIVPVGLNNVVLDLVVSKLKSHLLLSNGVKD